MQPYWIWITCILKSISSLCLIDRIIYNQRKRNRLSDLMKQIIKFNENLSYDIPMYSGGIFPNKGYSISRVLVLKQSNGNFNVTGNCWVKEITTHCMVSINCLSACLSIYICLSDLCNIATTCNSQSIVNQLIFIETNVDPMLCACRQRTIFLFLTLPHISSPLPSD